MNTSIALIKREILDGKNGYIRVPLILAGLTIALVLLTSVGVGELNFIDGFKSGKIQNLGEGLELAKQEKAGELPAAVTVGYWALSILTWMAFPFVVFFSLLSSLYEERRDRSILFWKSMPIDDRQEVLAKLFTTVIVCPLIFLVIAIAAQLIIAFLLSIVVLFQGGPVSSLWPVGLMLSSWFSAFGHYLLWALWALPVLAWVMFVSAYAERLPFMWAILTPVVLVIAENMFFDTHTILSWIGIQLGAWQDFAFAHYNEDPTGPRDVLNIMFGRAQWEGLLYSLTSLRFWSGLVIAAGFVFGSIELRKRGT
jgi:ABC-2 type transport system permease protein